MNWSRPNRSCRARPRDRGAGSGDRRTLRAPCDLRDGAQRQLGLDAAAADTLQRGALLHDIGKIAIPDRLLTKKTAPDRRRVRADEASSAHRRRSVPPRQVVGSRAADRPHHHERIDGRGYPDGLGGEQIPLVAQIVTVVDVFDALTTDRPYRRALSLESAWRIMRQEASNGAYSSDLVERLIDLHRRGCIDVPVPAISGRRKSAAPRRSPSSRRRAAR